MAVELSDYMRRVLKWSWLIAVVTVAGGVIALALTSQTSTAYVTSATVAPPGDVGTAAQAQQYVNDFQAAAGSRAVQDQVTEATGVPRDTISERVSVNRVGDSGLVSVSYHTPVRDDPKAEDVVDSVVNNTLTLMYESRVKSAQRGVVAAEEAIASYEGDVTAAQGRVDEFLAARSFISPVEELQSVEDQITQFRILETESRADGNVAAANTYIARLAELEQRRSALGKDALAYLALQAEVDSAKQQVVRGQEAREAADRAAAEVVPEGNTTFGRRNEAQDRAATIWRRTLAVMLACFVLSILLVAWLASLTPAHEASTAEEPEPEPEPGPDPMAEEEQVTRPRRRGPRQPKHDPDGLTVGAQPS